VTESRCSYITVPRFAAIPGLVLGFGRAGWSEADFLAFAASRGMRPVIMHQLHSDTIHRLDAVPEKKLDGDALMTSKPGLLLVIRTADCLPVLIVDETNRAVAAVHCGWRGTEKRILEKTIVAMGEAYGSKPAEMLAALGPCIGAACYEVGPEVRDGFLRAGFPETLFALRGHLPGIDAPLAKIGKKREPVPEARVPLLKPKLLLDLRAANVWLLRGLGFKKGHIFEPGPACTHCEPALLSYRRNPHDPRRMYNFIGLFSGS
jgi:YfiH family protein